MVTGEASEPPEYRVFLVPSRDYAIIDTWDALGLKGTGSHDCEIGQAFVPEHMSVAVADLAGGRAPGSAVNPAPLYQIPVFAMFPYVLSGPALGNAQACVDGYTAVTRGRTATFNAARLSDLQPIQIKLATAAAKVDTARKSTCMPPSRAGVVNAPMRRRGSRSFARGGWRSSSTP